MRSWQQLLRYPFPTLVEVLVGQQEHMSSACWQVLATNCSWITEAAETRFLRWPPAPHLVHGAVVTSFPILLPPPPITGRSYALLFLPRGSWGHQNAITRAAGTGTGQTHSWACWHMPMWNTAPWPFWEPSSASRTPWEAGDAHAPHPNTSFQ